MSKASQRKRQERLAAHAKAGSDGKQTAQAPPVKPPPLPIARLKNSAPQAHVGAVVRLIVSPLWSWPAVLLIVGTLLFGLWQTLISANEFYAANVTFGVGVLFFGAKVLCWVALTKEAGKSKLWAAIFVSMVLTMAFAAELFWVNQKAGRSENLHASIRASFVGMSRDAGFFLADFQGPRGRSLTPCNLVLSLVITNRSKDPLWLGRAEVEYKSDWLSWRSLYSIAANKLYTLPLNVPTTALHMIPDSPSIFALSDQPLEPERAYSAYALYQYPPGLDIKNTKLRLRVCDLDSNCSITNIDREDRPQVPMTNSADGFKFTYQPPSEDLSALPYVYLGDN